MITGKLEPELMIVLFPFAERGLLNLDTVWCYLCMKNVNDLEGRINRFSDLKFNCQSNYIRIDLDAAERLMKCDTCFVKVYGNSFQRLKALQKDGTGHMVLFVRLHLLQVI